MSEEARIELYLYSLNQEFPTRKDHQTFLKRQSEVYNFKDQGLMAKEQVALQEFEGARGDCPGFWIKNEWRLDFTKVIPPHRDAEENALQYLILREEEFGGIALDPTFDRVYKVNPSGYKLLQRMVQAARENRLSGFRSEEHTAEEIDRFTHFLKGAGLWGG